MAHSHPTPPARYAIRLKDGTLLACPHVPRSLPRPVRVQVYEYILRRQPALAFLAMEAVTDDDARRRDLLGMDHRWELAA